MAEIRKVKKFLKRKNRKAERQKSGFTIGDLAI
jgi:hypothetical protein